jgi:predicted extracellular nuclease
MTKTFSKVFSLALILALALSGLSMQNAQALGGGSGSISLTTLGSPSTQNFDALANTGSTNNLTINGWYLNETGTSTANNGQYQAGTGSGTGGDVYSFGAASSTERALGTLFSGTLTPTIGAQFTNNTGDTVTSLDISYIGEMWRAGVTNRGAADRLDFQLSTNATSLTTGTWVNYDSLDLNSPNTLATAGALNGNSATNQTALSFSITGLSIPNGSSFWVRWNEFDISPGADDGLAIDTFSITPRIVDFAPEVVDTFPDNGATDFPINANLSVTFSEPVNVTSSWFTLTCSVSGNVSTGFGGGPTTFTLDPSVPLVDGETCTLTVLANQVSDIDANDPPDNMVFNFVVGFTAFDVCAATYTPIYTIQGSGLSTPIPGNVRTKGVVVGDFEGSSGQQGFYMQDVSGDSDPTTSDGIFVFTGSSDLVSAGQLVSVTGVARERFDQTSITGGTTSTPVPTANIVNCGTGSVTATNVEMPFPDADYPERFEGMLVNFPQSLVISEYFNYERFGELVIALPLDGEARPFTGTSIDEPGAPALAREAANSLRRITLDDTLGTQNPAILRHPNGLTFDLTNRFRGGDTLTNTVGVMGYDFGLYRVQPTAGADYVAANPRPAAPEAVGGTVRVAAMNTLNFFVTLDPSGGPLDNQCGPANTLECRGADDAGEFIRQRDKLLTALSGLDADIIGLNELENSTGAEPLNSITSGLPGYSYINTGTIGTDAIKVGLIYRPAIVTPVGTYKLLTSAVDPRFIDTKSRPSLAQTFQVNATGARFTVVVDHFKSKGSACDDIGDPDLGDGQGNCSQTRRAAAEALVDWLATDPTSSGDSDYIIMGDLNSYAQEDSIDAIKAGSDGIVGTNDDFTNLISNFHGAYAYSYTFDGQAGYLDHALANASLFAQITGAADWHINSDEPDIFDYDTTFKPPSQDALYEVNPYRTSDHDPVVVGLNPLHYNFSGFFQPVDNAPTFNVVKGGSAVPVKFSLGGNQGLDIFLSGYPLSKQISCASSSPLDDIEQTLTAGGSSLSYDPTTDQYSYIWKTEKSWTGTCRQLSVILKDGSIHTANFKIK